MRGGMYSCPTARDRAAVVDRFAMLHLGWTANSVHFPVQKTPCDRHRRLDLICRLHEAKP